MRAAGSTPLHSPLMHAVRMDCRKPVATSGQLYRAMFTISVLLLAQFFVITWLTIDTQALRAGLPMQCTPVVQGRPWRGLPNLLRWPRPCVRWACHMVHACTGSSNMFHSVVCTVLSKECVLSAAVNYPLCAGPLPRCHGLTQCGGAVATHLHHPRGMYAVY